MIVIVEGVGLDVDPARLTENHRSFLESLGRYRPGDGRRIIRMAEHNDERALQHVAALADSPIGLPLRNGTTVLRDRVEADVVVTDRTTG